jgi:hypothetical protein
MQMGLFGSLFKVTRMNADPDQQHLARLFVEAAENGRHVQLMNWVINQPWNGRETRTRIAHALSIVKVAFLPATYARAREIGRPLFDASWRF